MTSLEVLHGSKRVETQSEHFSHQINKTNIFAKQFSLVEWPEPKKPFQVTWVAFIYRNTWHVWLIRFS